MNLIKGTNWGRVIIMISLLPTLVAIHTVLNLNFTKTMDGLAKTRQAETSQTERRFAVTQLMDGQRGVTFFIPESRWGKTYIHFYDIGFRGRPTKVRFYDEKGKLQEIQINTDKNGSGITQEDNIWIERYLEAREEATK